MVTGIKSWNPIPYSEPWSSYNFTLSERGIVPVPGVLWTTAVCVCTLTLDGSFLCFDPLYENERNLV